MTIEERATFTTLPNGVVDTDHGPRLRVSVFVAPRITADPGDGATLGDCDAFKVWPDALADIAFKIVDDAGHRVTPDPDPDPEFPAAHAKTWTDVFSPDLRVHSREPSDLGNRVLRSFPLATLVDDITQLYTVVAGLSPTEFPPVGAVAEALGPLVPLTGERERWVSQLEDLLPAGEWDRETGKAADHKQKRVLHTSGMSAAERRRLAYWQLARFYDRPDTEQDRTDTVTPPEPKRPELDFHRVCALVGDYPKLLRKLGLVLDFLVDPHDVPTQEGTGTIRVDASGTGAVGWVAEERVRPWTNYVFDDGLFVPLPFDGSDLRDGMLDVEQKDRFMITALDVDGSATKLIQLARTANTFNTQAASHDSKRISLPALRSGGIIVARTGRADRAEERTDATKEQETLWAQNKAAELWADDVTRGYRVDVEHDNKGDWKSLCERVGTYRMEWPGAPVDLDVPRGDEGYVKGSSATSVTGGDPDLYLHEAVFGWEGWSLVAKRPGKHVGQLEAEEYAPELADECPLLTNFTVADKSLPALRYSAVYRMRARAVDLAGNSHRLGDAPDDIKTKAVPFRRYDPVPPPVVVPRAAFTEGESVRRLVIRSTRGKAPAAYLLEPHVVALPRHASPPPAGAALFAYTTDNERHIIAAKTSQQMAELHGKFDKAMGVQDPSVYNDAFTLAGREEKVLADPAAPGFCLIGPAANSAIGVDQVPVPAVPPAGEGQFGDRTYWLRTEGEVTAPYLPDVFSTGAGFVGLPGAPVPFPPVAFEGAWPNVAGFRIRIVDGPATTPPVVVDEGAGGRVLVVTLPQATIAHVKLSSALTAEHLDDLAVWHLLTDQQRTYLQKAAERGEHWMLTPFEELTLVHAVEKPIDDPMLVLDDGVISREAADTFAVLQGHIDNHSRSTGRLDVDATWITRIDDVLKDGPENVEGAGHVADFDIEAAEDPALTGRDDSATGVSPRRHKVRHEFGDTKHREAIYTITATTRFREYFPPEITNNRSLITASTETGKLSVPSSRRPEPPDVLYAVPTFRWEDERWRRRGAGGAVQLPGHRRVRKGRGLRVYLNRPWYSSGDDEYLAVVVADQVGPWVAKLAPALDAKAIALARAGVDVDTLVTAAEKMARTRTGKAAKPQVAVAEMLDTVYAAVAAGPGSVELLTVSPELYKYVFITGDPSRYVTQWGEDPVWKAGGLPRGPRIESFVNRDLFDTGLPLAELPFHTVAAAAFKPEYDKARRLWYADIEIDPGPAYTPFIRMALARYQPFSVKGLELSRVVQAEFAQIVNDRRATLRRVENLLHVVVEGVAGFNYFSLWAHEVGKPFDYVDSSHLVRAWIERRRDTSQSDLDWKPITARPHALDHSANKDTWVSRWESRFETPKAEPGYEYRLAIEECELHETDPTQAELWAESTRPSGWSFFTGLEVDAWRTPVRGRLVYADHFPLVADRYGRLTTAAPKRGS